MKKIYNKPCVEVIDLFCTENIMAVSGQDLVDFGTDPTDGIEALSNSGSQFDVWGN